MFDREAERRRANATPGVGLPGAVHNSTLCKLTPTCVHNIICGSLHKVNYALQPGEPEPVGPPGEIDLVLHRPKQFHLRRCHFGIQSSGFHVSNVNPGAFGGRSVQTIVHSYVFSPSRR